MIDKEKLKYYRELNKMDFRTLSKKLKCPRKIIEHWEEGSRVPKNEDIKTLCILYGIEEKDLYKRSTTRSHSPVLYCVVFILSLLLGTLTNNVGIILISFITNLITTYAVIEFIKLWQARKKHEEFTSLFGISLHVEEKMRKRIYLIESLIISGFSIVLNIIFHLFHLDFLYITKLFIANKSVNEFVILGVSYLLLFMLSFIIELGFGEYALKKYKN